MTLKGSATQEASKVNFASNFNPQLADDSKYFKSLQAFMNCVEKNRGVAADQQD